MKLSYFMMPLHDKDRDYHQTLMEDTEAVILADELGFHEAWCGEHYSTSTEQITSPLLFFANLISRTKQINLCTGVVCLPQYHPALVAGQAAMFDHLSKGRFVMGVGPGGLPSDFELFGTSDLDRNAAFVEAMEMILELWASDPPFDIKGNYWHIKLVDNVDEQLGMGHMAKPFQKPHPPIAITAVSPNSNSVRIAARNGWRPVSGNFIPVWNLKTHWQVYEEEGSKHGKAVNRENWSVARSIFVDETDKDAEQFVRRPNGAFDYYFWYLCEIFKRGGSKVKAAFVSEQGGDPDKLNHQTMRDDFVICGSPETVARKILDLRDEIGHFGNLLMAAHDWVDGSRMKRSMKLMANEVMPIVHKEL